MVYVTSYKYFVTSKSLHFDTLERAAHSQNEETTPK